MTSWELPFARRLLPHPPIPHCVLPPSLRRRQRGEQRRRNVYPDLQLVPVDTVFSSPLRRAVKTALVAYPTEKIVVLPDLHQVDANAGLCRADLLAFVSATAYR